MAVVDEQFSAEKFGFFEREVASAPAGLSRYYNLSASSFFKKICEPAGFLFEPFGQLQECFLHVPVVEFFDGFFFLEVEGAVHRLAKVQILLRVAKL